MIDSVCKGFAKSLPVIGNGGDNGIAFPYVFDMGIVIKKKTRFCSRTFLNCSYSSLEKEFILMEGLNSSSFQFS